jgi:tetratricopeptide (TPR) repeat protein
MVVDEKSPTFAQPLPTRMAGLAGDHSTGTLVIGSEDARREIFFVNGEIRAARSNVEGEMLGMWLVERQWISEDERALTLLAQGADEIGTLGHILVKRGCITQSELEAELQELTLEIIRRAASEESPRFGFMGGQGDPQPDTLPNITTSQIILTAARECRDQVAMWDLLGSFDQKVSLQLSIESVLGQLELTPSEGFILSRLDAAKDLSALKHLSTMPEQEVVSSLYALVVSGVVAIDAAAPPDDPAAVAVAEEPPVEEPAGVEIDAGIDESGFDEHQRDDRHRIMDLAKKVTRIDHYRALGLKQGAEADQIEKAFTVIRKRYSPKRVEEPHLVDQRANLSAIVDRAREAYELLSDPKARRRYDKVLTSVEKAQADSLSTRPRTDPEARAAMVKANIARADQLIATGETYLAIQLLEQACSMDPQPEELLKLAKLQMRNPLWIGRALERLRIAVEVDPTFVRGWVEIANFWEARGHTERQRKALERAVGADPWSETAAEMYKKLVGGRELDRLLRRVR